MQAGARKTERCAPDGRIVAGVILLLLTQCSPDRYVLLGGPDAPGANVDAASVGGNPTAGTGGGPGAGGTFATGGTYIGGTGGVACADSSYPSLCEHGFEIFQHIHAGCTVYECGPISDCNVDGDCPNGQVCFAGAECDDACTLPSCCSGNRCGPPSCPALNDVTCLAVGCPVGDVCNATCNSARCTCDGASWNCTYDGGATPSCASACVLP